MKKIQILIIIAILLIAWFWLSYKNSNNSNIIYNHSGLQVTQSLDKSVSILKLDLIQLNLDFWGVESDNVLETPDSKLDRFNRLAATQAQKLSWYPKVLAWINGQFFNANKNPTFLSFPLMSNKQIISSYVDNQLQKKTFVIGDDYIPRILDWYKADMLLNSDYKDLIVWIHPDENFMKNSSLPRNFMWILDNTTLIFILATSKTQGEMTQLMYDQWVSQSNIIMFDGWPSAQFALFDYSTEKPTIQDHYGRWAVPHFFVVSEK
jgi:hypothetical protein